MNDTATSNKRRAAAILAVSVALPVLVAVIVTLALGIGPVLVVVTLVVAAALATAAWLKSDALALSRSGAVPADPASHARLHNLVEGLCIAGGVPKPQLYVVQSDAPNAYAIGRDPRHASIAVTTGLLDKLTRIELEGVLAHELSHIKSYDTRVSTLAVTLRLGLAALSPRRESLADVTGVALTRYPPGLISALEKLRDDASVVHPASRATAHLWIEAPTTNVQAAGRPARRIRLFDTHPPLDERIQALREL